MITFKQQLTVSDELVQAMAQKLRYEPFIDGVKNEVSYEEFVQEKAKEYMIGFFLPLGEEMIEQQLVGEKEQLREQIISPVIDNFVTEVIKNDII